MKIIVKPHDIQISETDTVNEGEYNITQLNFEFSAEYTDDLVKKAIFIGNDNKTYEMVIDNNICNIPSEILVKQQSVFLGVYAYKITGSELVLRYSPSPVIFPVIDGSYKADAVPSEEITPSQFEQYQQALQNGLSEVNEKLQEVIDTSIDLEENGTYAKEQGDYAKAQGDYAEEQGNYAKSQGDYAKNKSDDLQNKADNGEFDGATFTPSVSDTGDLSWTNDKGLQNPSTVNIKGEKGDTGEPFTISKTYPSVEAMNADFDNMEVGDYVMIASSVEDEDNAKLYVKTDTEWVFITDFSGAIGIQGEPGVGITTVTSGQSTQQDGNTVTPITVNKTDGSSEQFNISAKNGKNGIDGQNGTDGIDGITPNIQIGTVTTLEPNEQATVTRTGTNEQPVFNFGIPQGQQGEQGIQGIPGQDGQPGADGLPGQDGADGKDATINGQNTVEITTDNNITLEQQESVLKLGLNSQLIDKQDAEGTDNTFDDGLESPLFALSGDGKSEQVVTTGANLLNLDVDNNNQSYGGMTVIIDKDSQTVTFNGSLSNNPDGGFSYFNKQFPLKEPITIPSGTYDFFAEVISGTGTASGNNGRIRNIQLIDNNGASYGINSLNGSIEINKGTFTFEQSVTIVTIQIIVYSNITLNNYKIGLYFGKQNVPYEPYTGGQPSPSPDYPQEINSIEGSVEFACRGKNLFNKNTVVDGYISQTGQIESNSGFKTSDFIKVMSNTSYFLNNTNTRRLKFYDINKNAITSDWDLTSAGSQSFTTLRNAYYLRFSIDINVIDINTVQLELGTQATSYEPYIEPNEVTFNLGQEKLRSVGDVKDELVVDLDTGDYYKVEKISEIILDGSIDFYQFSDVNKYGNILFVNYNALKDKRAPANYINYPNVISNYFKETLENIWVGNIVAIDVDDSQMILVVPQTLATTSEELKAWLQQHNVVVDYRLANPQTVPLGTLSSEDLAKLKTFKGYNNVTVNTNIGLMNIRFTYGLDIKKYIDNKLAEISSAMIEEG